MREFRNEFGEAVAIEVTNEDGVVNVSIQGDNTEGSWEITAMEARELIEALKEAL